MGNVISLESIFKEGMRVPSDWSIYDPFTELFTFKV